MNKNKITFFYCIFIISIMLLSSIVIAKEGENGKPDLCNKFEEKKDKWEHKWENKEAEDKDWGDKWEEKREDKIEKLDKLKEKFCDECDDDDDGDDDNGDDNDDDDNSNYIRTTSIGKSKNIAPISDTSAGEPYIGFINEEIEFNGSNSYDPDGYIAEFIWVFSNGSIKKGETVYNSFNEKGDYEVLLTVKDNDGAMNSTKTIAIIIQPNNPPSKPSINAKSTGFTDTLYDFSVLSFDIDDDNIRYYIDWGDGKNSTSQFVKNGTEMIFQYSWNKTGIYTISVKAYDGYTFSDIAEFKIDIGINTASILSEILLFILLILILVSIYLLISHRNREKPKKI